MGHFHPPSIEPGVTAVLWGLALGVFIYFGLVAIGTSHGVSFVLALVLAAAIALFVRLRGEDATPRG